MEYKKPKTETSCDLKLKQSNSDQPTEEDLTYYGMKFFPDCFRSDEEIDKSVKELEKILGKPKDELRKRRLEERACALAWVKSNQMIIKYLKDNIEWSEKHRLADISCKYVQDRITNLVNDRRFIYGLPPL